MRKTLKRVIAASILLLGLLATLILVEGRDPEASIRTVPEALWYMLTTLTTVGYGDLYPVTPAGRAVGAVLQLCSLGLLAFLIGTMISVLRGRLRSMLQLRFRRKRDWYIFASAQEPSRCLAKALRAESPDCVIVFSAPEDPADLPGIPTELSVSELVRFRGKEEGVSLFFLSDDYARNEEGAAEFADTGCRCYCLSPHGHAVLPAGQLPLKAWEICARLYWQRFPLRSPREKIMLIGDGHYAEALLEQALLVNVVSLQQQVQYTLCGDFSRFRACHPALEPFAAGTQDGDRLIYSDLPWQGDREALWQADRIIFCSDREEENLDRLTTLQRYFPAGGQLHVRYSRPLAGAETFGSPEELYTPELVMRGGLDRMAAALHKLYRDANGGPAWEELGEFARRSNLAAADHLRVKIRLLLPDAEDKAISPALFRRAYDVFAAADDDRRSRFRELEHVRWTRFHLLDNWSCGPQRDNARRIHPLLRPFDQLDAKEQEKDDYAWQTLKMLGAEEWEGIR